MSVRPAEKSSTIEQTGTARADGQQPRSSGESTVIGAVIVARMNSSRLPGKSMSEFAGHGVSGRSSLEWMVRRLSRSRYIKKFVFATTTHQSDDVIAALAEKLGHQCFRGSEQDVLARVCGALRAAQIDLAVHVTGDCPLVDAELADACVELFLKDRTGPDYVSVDIETYPPGLDVEVFSTDALAEIESSFTDPWVREHVTVPFYTMPERFVALKAEAPAALRRPQYRICVDTAEDYQVVREIFSALLPQREQFGAEDIVRLLDARPDLVAINASIKETKYTCGVIGLGNIGTLYEHQSLGEQDVQTHARADQRYGRTRLLAGCDVDSDRRIRFKADWKIDRVYATPSELFAKEKLDIVSIATPPESHAELCLQAVAAGVKAIFCEKPFVIDPAQGRRVIEACAEHGVLLAVNFSRRWSRKYRALRDFMAQGGLGEVQTVRLHYTKGLLHNGSHGIDLLRFLFGEIVEVLATDSIRTDSADVDIGGVLQMQSPNRTCPVIMSSTGKPNPVCGNPASTCWSPRTRRLTHNLAGHSKMLSTNWCAYWIAA